MKIRDLLRHLDFGSPVAEFDSNLENYFVDTEALHKLLSGERDVYAGDKGTGKTALFRIFRRRLSNMEEKKKIEVVQAFNVTGNPVFQRLAALEPLSESQYRAVWISYVLSLLGNWLLDIFGADAADELETLDSLLTRTGLRSNDDSPETIFSKIVNYVSRFLRPKSASAEFTFSETGLPMVTPKVEFDDGGEEKPERQEISYDDALRVLQSALAKADIEAWMAIDRLDEAFSGQPSTEIPALRALFRVYLDLQAYPNIRLKLFVRRDLFRRIIQGGFVNLTHVNAKKFELSWEEEDLKHLFASRVRESKAFLKEAGLEGKSDDEVFNAIFPLQVGQGAKRPTTWNWMMSRIRDGNSIRPPRNLIDLVTKAREYQIRNEERVQREFTANEPIIEADAVKRAHKALSEQRVQDTLLAEASDLAPLIERFRGGKAEQNVVSLAAMLNVPEDQVRNRVKPLQELGFIEEVGSNFKVPMLYRDGLGITQGKAFEQDGNTEIDDDE